VERILVVGAGYTGARVVERLRGRHHVLIAGRSPNADLHVDLPGGSPFQTLPGDGYRVLWTAPIVEGIEHLEGKAARVVYLSTTGVYGDAPVVDEHTPPAPVTERASLRYAAEQFVERGSWSTCILRPAAIYGPGRGAHESIRQGRWRMAGDGSNYTSRIHVDDLATICAAALLSDCEGAWPVADDEPCTNLEITRFCCGLLHVPLPSAAPLSSLDETRRANRRVDGRAIRAVTGVTLRYPSYRIGVPASLDASS
jgi:nucleoside-diphosphate-sugar epimerase